MSKKSNNEKNLIFNRLVLFLANTNWLHESCQNINTKSKTKYRIKVWILISMSFLM